MTDERATAVLRRMEEESRRQWEGRVEIPVEQRYLLVGPETGQFVNILVRSSGAKRILEIGTSAGYSTIWLATAARETGGRVTATERVEQKIALARKHWAEAGVDDLIDLREGDAIETVRSLDGPWDFVLIDAWKDDYETYLDLVYPKVVPGGLIVADNMTTHKDTPEIQAYIRKCQSHPGLDSVTVPIGSGEELSVKRR